MDELKAMIQTVINGQHALKRELLEEISALRKEFNSKLENETGSLRHEIETLSYETKKGFAEVNERLDKQGAQLAYLEDDAPTREEHDKLEKRVKKIEKGLKN